MLVKVLFIIFLQNKALNSNSALEDEKATLLEVLEKKSKELERLNGMYLMFLMLFSVYLGHIKDFSTSGMPELIGPGSPRCQLGGERALGCMTLRVT